MTETTCGHPNHGGWDHACAPFRGEGFVVSDARVEAACEVMHDAYEMAALGAGWETNPASRKPWADVPEPNKVTMRAAVAALLAWLASARMADTKADTPP